MQQATTLEDDIRDSPSSREFVSGLRRHLPTIAAVAFIVTMATVLASFAQPSRYTSSASIVLATNDNSTSRTNVNMATEKQIASSTTVADAVILSLHLGVTPDEVLRGLSLTVPVNTEVLVFSYTSTDPREAQRRAQAFASAYLEYRREQLIQSANDASTQAIQARIDVLRTQLQMLTLRASSQRDPGKHAALEVSSNALLVQISVQEQELASKAGALATSGRLLAAASLPTSPSGPRLVVNAILGLFVGVVLGTFTALGRASLATRMHTEQDVEQAMGAPVLAVIPRSRRAKRRSPIVVTGRASPAVDAYRRLVVKLLASPTGGQSLRKAIRTIAVVSLDDKAQTEIVVANLGAAMALAGKVVLLASAAADGSGLEAIFGTAPQPGLSDVIRRETSLSDAIRSTTIESLGVLPAGSEQGGWALLDTGAVRRAIDEMAASADVVMIDAPARAAAASGALVAACDAVLLVGLFRSTSLEDVRRTRAELKMLGTRSIGIVMFERRLPHRYGRTPEGLLASEQTDSPTVDRPDDRPESSSGRDLLLEPRGNPPQSR